MTRFLRWSFVVASLAFASVAAAGFKANTPVYVVTMMRWAYGAIGSARSSADTTQYIGCALYSTTTDTAARAYCYARDAVGVTVTCSTADPRLVAVAQSINPDSFVSFQWDTAGSCTSLQLSQLSYHPPKQP